MQGQCDSAVRSDWSDSVSSPGLLPRHQGIPPGLWRHLHRGRAVGPRASSVSIVGRLAHRQGYPHPAGLGGGIAGSGDLLRQIWLVSSEHSTRWQVVLSELLVVSVEDLVDWVKSKFGKSPYQLVRGGKLPDSMVDDDFGLDDSVLTLACRCGLLVDEEAGLWAVRAVD